MKHSLRKISIVLTSCLVSGAIGCGETTYPLQGKVQFEDGSPVPLAVVVFEEEGGVRSGVARADESGNFTEVTFDAPGDGLPAGNYRIVVNPPDPITLTEEQLKLSPGPGWGIPNEYRAKEKTPLTLEVPISEETLTIALKKGAGSAMDLEEINQIKELMEDEDEEGGGDSAR